MALWVQDFPKRVLPLLNQTLMDEASRKFKTYADLKSDGETELRVAIHSFQVTEMIRELKQHHLWKLVCVKGVATKRSGVYNQVKRLSLLCAKCGFGKGPFDMNEERELKPGACIECQSRGPWKVDRKKTLYQNFQKVTLQESPSEVEPGKMPRSKEVILTGDQVDTVRPGDAVTVTGVYNCLYDAGSNARTCFPVYRTQIDCVHMLRKGDMRHMQPTDTQRAQILQLAKHPNIREKFIASMAPSIYGMWHVKTAIALSMMGAERKVRAGGHSIRGDINTLIVGDPGLAKSQFLKYVESTFARSVYATGKGASAVGLTAAVTKGERGEFCLEGGAMVLADGGICLIDEFDKMNDQDRTSIHEAMEQQSISISKAGIVASLKAQCAVIAVANPTEGRYDPQKTFMQNVNLSDPILSRFDLLCVLRDEADPVQDELLGEFVVCSHVRSHPEATAEDRLLQPRLQRTDQKMEPIEQDLLQKYIIYARTNIHPKIMDIDMDKLSSFYRDIRQEAFRTGGVPMTARHMDSLIRLAEANARMELRQYVSNRDVDNAIAIMLESFIQSQKHQVSEELRKKFRRYITQATPLTDQLAALLERLFKEEAKEIQRRRPDQEMPDMKTVGVSLAQVAKEVEHYDLALEDMHSFLASPRFKQAFRLEGETLFLL